MKLTIPVNWEDDYFDKIDFSQTEEIYGKLNIGLIGGGRPALTLPTVNKEKVREFVKEAHRRNLNFNYLMNGTCFDNLEITKTGYKDIRKTLDWLSEINVDGISVSLPMVMEIIKKNYPHFKISVSVQVRIDSFEKARYWESLGADKLNISYVDINKNFDEIKKIKEKTSCKIQTIANLMCMNKCPMVTLHANYNAHASQKNHVSDNFSFDYYLFSCAERLLSDPVEILKSAFIRPEDLHYYEEAGVDNIKLVERIMTTDALALIVKAYTNRSYDGNMMDLIHGLSKYLIYNKDQYYFHGMKYVLQPSKINMLKAFKLVRKLDRVRKNKAFNESFDLYIDNKKLDGFLDFFHKGNCQRDCTQCNYCNKFAAKAIRYLVPLEQHQEAMSSLRDARNMMIKGELF
ncbi:MAG TPA: U32 family peptidase [Chitinophagaceae bacterium]|nr:U32 family peptidase [Chitinophagaceae bacterium]